MKKLKRMYRCMEERKHENDKTTGYPTKTLGHDRRCGFTLVELVIVIAIVIILSVISVPIYRGYVDKAKMAECYALAGSILSAQKAYFSEYGNFLGKPGDSWYTDIHAYEPVLGVDARGNKYFTLFTPNHSRNYSSESVGKNIWIGIQVPPDLRYLTNNRHWFVLYYNTISGIVYGSED